MGSADVDCPHDDLYWVPTLEMCDAHRAPEARTRLLAGQVTMPDRPLERKARALADAAVAGLQALRLSSAPF
jgi:hypothetical protein